MTDTVTTLAAMVGGTVEGDGGRTITGVADQVAFTSKRTVSKRVRMVS